MRVQQLSQNGYAKGGMEGWGREGGVLLEFGATRQLEEGVGHLTTRQWRLLSR